MRFWLRVFSWISLPPAPEYTIRAISNFLWQFAEKFAAHGPPPDIVAIIWKFAEKFAAHGPPPDIVAIICYRCRHWHRWQLSPVSPTLTKMVAKFVSLIPVENCCWYYRQIYHRCRSYRWCILTCKYLREFLEKFETVLMDTRGLGGKSFMKKTISKKSRDTVPLKGQKL